MTTLQPSREIATAKIGDRHPLSLVLFALTAVSGLVDAASYLGLGHVFTANMTGNVVIVGFALAGSPGFSLSSSLVSLGAFLAGSVAAGRLAVAFSSRHRVPWVRTALISEAALLTAATILAFATGGRAQLALIAPVAFAMGLRNGTVRKLAVPDMTTTVLTLTLTGIASDSRLAGGSDPRTVRRVSAVFLMVIGAYLGAVLVLHHGIAWPLLIGAATVSVAAIGYRERG